MKTIFSTKGQVVIPKAFRDAKGFAPGVEVEVIDHPDGVLIKAVSTRKKHQLGELVGLLAPYYNGPTISIEEMNEAVEDAAVERFLRSRI